MRHNETVFFWDKGQKIEGKYSSKGIVVKKYDDLDTWPYSIHIGNITIHTTIENVIRLKNELIAEVERLRR